MNDQRNPPFPVPTPEQPMSVALANPIRKVLWTEDSLREQFLSESAADLGAAERELIGSWKQRVSGRFVAFKHLQKHSIFMSKDVFAVVGIYSPLAELIVEPRHRLAIVVHRYDRGGNHDARAEQSTFAFAASP